MASTTCKVGGAIAALAFLVGGCSQASPEVTSVYGPGLRFSETTRTYTWAPGASRTSGEGRPKNANVDRIIRESTKAHLARKGYVESTGAGVPDFWVDYRVGTSLRGDAYGAIDTPQYKEGILAMYALDPATSKLIWRGSIQARIDESSTPDQIRTMLDTVVGKVLDQVPSRTAK